MEQRGSFTAGSDGGQDDIFALEVGRFLMRYFSPVYLRRFMRGFANIEQDTGFGGIFVELSKKKCKIAVRRVNWVHSFQGGEDFPDAPIEYT